MEIQYYGANCLKITTKKATIVVDDTNASVLDESSIALFTGSHTVGKKSPKISIEQPGEYEVSNTSIQGIPARGHMEQSGQWSHTIYKIIADDVRVAVVGHVYPEISDEQLESLGTIDILTIPVGGNGYTLDAVGALKLIKKIEPKIIIPTHYADAGVNYEVPQNSLETVLKELAMEPKEPIAKLKLKPGEVLGESNQLIVLERQ